jgi:hypothetical protein
MLTLEEMMLFWGKPCAYCDREIVTIGLDRVDNNKGYVVGNLVACCGTCNMMKADLALEAFKAHIRRLYHRLSQFPGQR